MAHKVLMRLNLSGPPGIGLTAFWRDRDNVFGQFWNDIHQSSQQAFRIWVEGAAPWLWNSVVRVLLDQPVFAVLGVLGILLMILFRPRKPLIGYSRD